MEIINKLFSKKQISKNDINEEALEIKDELKGLLKERWDYQESSHIPFEGLYKQMVEEAVLVIKKDWIGSVKNSNKYKCRSAEAEVEACNVFFLTEDFRLYSYSISAKYTFNPQTNRECFSSTITFPNQNIADQYIADILARLPAETVCTKKRSSDVLWGNVVNYSFTIKLTDLEN